MTPPVPDAPTAPAAPAAAPAPCADPNPTMATIDLATIGSPLHVVSSGGEVLVGVSGSRAGAEGAIYRAEFDTSSLEVVASGYAGGDFVVLGDQIVASTWTSTQTGQGTMVSPGNLATFDLASGARTVHEGPVVTHGPWSAAGKGEVIFVGGAGNDDTGIWSWQAARGFERRTDDSIGKIFTDGTDTFRFILGSSANANEQTVRLERLDRSSSRFVTVVAKTIPANTPMEGAASRDALYLYDATARTFDVFDKRGQSIRSFERRAFSDVPFAARVIVGEDAIYILEGASLHRVDKETGADEEIGMHAYPDLAANAVADDACYVYVALAAGPGKLTRLPKGR